MDNLKEPKKKGNALVIILIILILGLVAYIVCDKVFLSDKTDTKKVNDNIKCDECEKCEECICEKDETKCENTNVNFDLANRKATVRHRFDHAEGQGYALVEIDKIGNVKICVLGIEDKSKDSCFEINISRVATVTSSLAGNSGDSMLIFIKEDGSVSVIESIRNLISNGNITVKNISGLKNIVMAATTSTANAWDPVFIDYQGKEYKYSDYR